jgi:NADPH-dependent curcumin reductase CurA
MDFYHRRREAEAALATWVEQGKIKPAIDVVEGFEKMPTALAGMFAGQNRGKLMVRV